MGSRLQKAGFPNWQEDSAVWQVAGADELKDAHMAGFWSAVPPGTVALNALLPMPLRSKLFQIRQPLRHIRVHLFPQALVFRTVR